MSSAKLRGTRPQLFVYTSDGRRALAVYQPPQPPPRVPPRVYSQGAHPVKRAEGRLAGRMEVGLGATYGASPGPGGGGSARGSPASKGLHVNFTEKGEVKERREKFLTAKYGSHQMSLIRKRLAVEMWLYDELQKLFESADKNSPEVEVDIDELLDMDDDAQRRRHLQEILSEAKKSPLDVKKFVDDLLERTKTL